MPVVYQIFIFPFRPSLFPSCPTYGITSNQTDIAVPLTITDRYFHNDALITNVFLQILDAVEYCHEQGVYHRDLKPENVLCNEDGSRVVLADFGLATRQLVSDDLGVGSGYYMSPGMIPVRFGSFTHISLWSHPFQSRM